VRAIGRAVSVDADFGPAFESGRRPVRGDRATGADRRRGVSVVRGREPSYR
jgi:hypothetical protein